MSVFFVDQNVELEYYFLMSVEYYQNEEDPSIKIREAIRRNPSSIRGLLQQARVENPTLTEHDFLDDLGFEGVEIANFLARGF